MRSTLLLLVTILLVLATFSSGKGCNAACQAQLAAQQAAQQAAAAAAAAAQAAAEAAAAAAAKAAQEAATAALSSLKIIRSNDNLPVDKFAFDPNVKEYSFDVPAETPSLIIQAVSSLPIASVTANIAATMNTPVTLSNTGGSSQPFPLVSGPNIVQVTVTSQDKTNTVVYKFTANQVLSTVAALSMLQIHLMDGTPVKIHPDFSKDVQQYNVTIPATSAGILLTACTKSPAANMFVSMNTLGTPITMTDQNNQTTLPLTADTKAAFVSINVQAQNTRVIMQTSLTITRANQAQLNEAEADDASTQLQDLNNKMLQNSQPKQPVTETKEADTQPETSKPEGGISTLNLALMIGGSILGGFLFASFLFFIKIRLESSKTVPTNRLATGNPTPVAGVVRQ